MIGVQSVHDAAKFELNTLNMDELFNLLPSSSDLEAAAESELEFTTVVPTNAFTEELSDVEAITESELTSVTEEPMNLSPYYSADFEISTESELTSVTEEPKSLSPFDSADVGTATESEMTTHAENSMNGFPHDISGVQVPSESEKVSFSLEKLIAYITLSQSNPDAIPEDDMREFLKQSIPDLCPGIRRCDAIVKTMIGLDQTIKILTPVLPLLSNSLNSLNIAALQLTEIFSRRVESLEGDVEYNIPSQVPQEVSDAMKKVFSAINDAIYYSFLAYPKYRNATASLTKQIPNMILASPTLLRYIRTHSNEIISKLHGTFPNSMLLSLNSQKFLPHLFNSYAALASVLPPVGNGHVPSLLHLEPFFGSSPSYHSGLEYHHSPLQYPSSSYYFIPQQHLSSVRPALQYPDGFYV